MQRRENENHEGMVYQIEADIIVDGYDLISETI